MNKEGYTDKEISEVIGRSVPAIQCHRSISKSKKFASNARKRWTKDEEVRLVELYTDGFNKNQIAKKLGRSKDAINRKLYSLENEGDF